MATLTKKRYVTSLFVFFFFIFFLFLGGGEKELNMILEEKMTFKKLTRKRSSKKLDLCKTYFKLFLSLVSISISTNHQNILSYSLSRYRDL